MTKALTDTLIMVNFTVSETTLKSFKLIIIMMIIIIIYVFDCWLVGRFSGVEKMHVLKRAD